jgi:hypothetical protein
MCKSRIVFFFTFKDYRGHLNTRYFNFEGGCARTHRTPPGSATASNKNSMEQLQKGVYYKWSDEGHIRSTTIQFNIDYQIEKDHFLI